jgi:hypothetical protein
MEEKCWICGNIANSNEHKFKASRIKKMFGKQFAVPLIFKTENKEREIQGPNSKLLKFTRNICVTCNNVRTQGHDQAFEKLISSIIQQYENIEDESPFRVSKFYNENWEWNYENLLKYFAKIIGCRLSENGFLDKTETLSRYIKGEIENTFILLTFEAKQGTKLLLDATRNDEFSKTSFNGESCHYITEDFQEFFHGWTSVNWFTVHWVYSVDKTFDKQKIYSANNYVKLIPLNVQGRNENIHPLDWFEISHINTQSLRKEFILNLINEYQ